MLFNTESPMEFLMAVEAKLAAINAGATPSEILEVNTDASYDELKEAYGRLSKRFHPDLQAQLEEYSLDLEFELNFIFNNLTDAIRTLSGNKFEEILEEHKIEEPPKQKLEDQYIGSTFSSRYQIDLKLAQGGMAAVYRATDLVLDRAVAIKILSHGMNEDDTLIMRFLREARAAARIQHPNVVTVYDLGHLPNGCTFMVMEFLQGFTLRTLIREKKKISPPLAVELMKQICKGVAAAHRAGVIHRDLKPENVMLDDIGLEEFTAKLVDLGVARLRGVVNEGGNVLTPSTEVLGTPAYMSPEQCVTSKIDERSDIYSLGVIFYEMLTGQTPFHGPIGAIMRDHLYSQPPKIRAANPAISASLENLILKMLAKDKESPPGLMEIVKELKTFNETSVQALPQCNPPRPETGERDSKALTKQLRAAGSGSPLSSRGTEILEMTDERIPLPTRGQKRQSDTLRLTYLDNC